MVDSEQRKYELSGKAKKTFILKNKHHSEIYKANYSFYFDSIWFLYYFMLLMQLPHLSCPYSRRPIVYIPIIKTKHSYRTSYIAIWICVCACFQSYFQFLYLLSCAFRSFVKYVQTIYIVFIHNFYNSCIKDRYSTIKKYGLCEWVFLILILYEAYSEDVNHEKFQWKIISFKMPQQKLKVQKMQNAMKKKRNHKHNSVELKKDR